MELYRPGIDVRAEAIVAKSRPWSRVAISEPPCAAGQGRTGSRVVKDGSVHDEHVVFSQLRVLAQQRDPRDAARAVVSRDGGGLTRPEDGKLQGAVDPRRQRTRGRRVYRVAA
jgi:hypothetical protein